jgi:hypothetical protein
MCSTCIRVRMDECKHVMKVRMHACVDACIHSYTLTYLHTYIHTYMHTYIHKRTYVPAHEHACTHFPPQQKPHSLCQPLTHNSIIISRTEREASSLPEKAPNHPSKPPALPPSINASTAEGARAAEFLSRLPSKYDQRYRFNFTVVQAHPEMPDRGLLRENELREARRALLMYEDFRQKKSIAKINKMRQDQKALPIYAYRERIIKAVQENQVHELL